MTVIIICGVWIFCASMIIGVHQMRKNAPEPSTLPPLTTGAPLTQAPPPETTAKSEGETVSATAGEKVTVDSNNPQQNTEITVGDPEWLVSERESEEESKKAAEEESKKAQEEKKFPKTKQEIIFAYVEAVNALKAEPNFKVTKTNKFNVVLDEFTGTDALKKIADEIIKTNTASEPLTYTFKDGMAQETGAEQLGASPNQVIAPEGKTAFIDEQAVKSAETKKNADGGYTLKIFLNAETQTVDTPAKNHSNCMETIDMEALGLPSGAQIDEMNILYDDSYIEAVLNKDGKLTKITHYVKIPQADGNGKFLMSIEMKAHGDFTSVYEIEYTAQ